jgi:hypothetical protein
MHLDTAPKRSAHTPDMYLPAETTLKRLPRHDPVPLLLRFATVSALIVKPEDGDPNQTLCP